MVSLSNLYKNETSKKQHLAANVERFEFKWYVLSFQSVAFSDFEIVYDKYWVNLSWTLSKDSIEPICDGF